MAADQGDDLEKLVVEDRRYNDQKPWSDTLPMEFSFQELERLKREDEVITEKNERDHKAILELFKKGFSSLLPEELQPVLNEFADALIDGAVDTTDEAIFPQRITGHERFSTNISAGSWTSRLPSYLPMSPPQSTQENQRGRKHTPPH